MALWDRIERTLAGLFGFCALGVGPFQVFSRYIDPRLAVGWGDEVVVYFTVWAIFIIASQLVRTDGHVRPDIVLRLMKPRGQRVTEIFNCLVALVFCGGLISYGIQICSVSFQLDERSSTGLGFPMWIYYAALPGRSTPMAGRYATRLSPYSVHLEPATLIIQPRHQASH